MLQLLLTLVGKCERVCDLYLQLSTGRAWLLVFPPTPIKEKNIPLLVLTFLVAEMKKHSESCSLIFKVLLQQSYNAVWGCSDLNCKGQRVQSLTKHFILPSIIQVFELNSY